MEARIRTKAPNLIVSRWFEKIEQDLDRITTNAFYIPNKQGRDVSYLKQIVVKEI